MAKPHDDGYGGGGFHFKVTWLIPVFVLLGLLLLLAVGGKIWGRVSFAKERAIKRQERRRLEAQRQADRSRDDYDSTERWQIKGWVEHLSPNASLEMQREYADDMDEDEEEYEEKAKGEHEAHGVQLYDGPVPYDDGSDAESEHDLRGPLSALGSHLAGAKNGRAPPPPARMETDRFGNMVTANSWWSVQWSRRFAAGHGSRHGSYDGLDNLHKPDPAASWVKTQQKQQQLHDANVDVTQKRDGTAGTKGVGGWSRFKQRLTENIGWGYDGTSPALDRTREDRFRALVLPPQPPTMWSRLPMEDDENMDAHPRIQLHDPPPRLQSDAGNTDMSAATNAGMPVLQPILDRSLPPTPFVPATPTPASRTRSQKRTASLTRSQTDLDPTPLSRSRTGTTASTARSKPSMKADAAVRQGRAIVVDEEEGYENDDDDDARPPRRYKSMSSMAVSSASGSSKTDAGAVQRQATYAASSGHRGKQSRQRDGQPVERRGTKFARRMKQPVNFGSDDEQEREGVEDRTIVDNTQIPAIDSFVLTRTRTKRAEQDKGADGEAIRKSNSRRNSMAQSESSIGSSAPALTRSSSRRAGSSTDDDERAEEPVARNKSALLKQALEQKGDLAAIDDLTSEIDSVLLSVIARSNTSKSYARSVGGFASAAVSPHQPASPSTPMGRSKTWRKQNGQWVRIASQHGDQTESQQTTPARPPSIAGLPASPQPLPTPPTLPTSLPRALLAGSPQRKPIELRDESPSRRAGPALSSSSYGSIHSSHSRPDSSLSGRSGQSIGRGRAAQGVQMFASGDSRGNLRPGGRRNHGRVEEDLFFTGSDVSLTTAELIQQARHNSSAGSNRSQSIQSSSTGTNGGAGEMERGSAVSSELSSTSGAPRRRAALAKRASPRRYTAKLASGDGEMDNDYDEEEEGGDAQSRSPDNNDDNEGQSHISDSTQGRLHTGKSVRTPADKRRERQYAMDRVQSIVTRAQAVRMNQPEPELWLR